MSTPHTAFVHVCARLKSFPESNSRDFHPWTLPKAYMHFHRRLSLCVFCRECCVVIYVEERYISPKSPNGRMQGAAH